MNNKQLFYCSLNKCDNIDYLKKYIIYYTSSVISKIKPAELVVIKKSHENTNNCWNCIKDEISQALGLCFEEIYINDFSICVLFYNKSLFIKNLNQFSKSRILKDENYDTCSLDTIFFRLKQRFKEVEFPHEIGVFLGYPEKDVQSYIEHKGKNYIFCKYWKVYHDLHMAVKVMDKIDSVKNRAALYLYKELPIDKILYLLKSA